MRFTVKQGQERRDEERAEQKYLHVWKCKGTDSNGAKNGDKETNDYTAAVPSISFNDLGGLEKEKELICRQMLHLRQPQIYTQLGVKPPAGVLLHGPPGTGKTALAKEGVNTFQ